MAGGDDLVRLTPVTVSGYDDLVRLTPVAVRVYDIIAPSYGCGGVVVFVRLTSVAVSVHDIFVPVYGCDGWGVGNTVVIKVEMSSMRSLTCSVKVRWELYLYKICREFLGENDPFGCWCKPCGVVVG